MSVLQKGTLTSNTTTTVFETGNTPLTLFVNVIGGFGGGTIAIQASPSNDESTFTPIGTTLTAAGWLSVDLPALTRVRLALTGATAPTITYYATV